MIDVSTALRSVRRVVGEPFTGIGRALDLGIVCFGKDVAWTDSVTNVVKSASEYALHAHCPFRITRKGRILIGSDDMLRSLPTQEDEDRSLYDRNAVLLEPLLTSSSPVVVDVRINTFFDVEFDIAGDLRIQVFRASAGRSESWRFFRRGSNNHVVVPDA